MTNQRTSTWQRAPRARQAGLGSLLVLVLVLLFVLAVIGFSHGRFASSIALELRRDAIGDRALELATSALASAHFAVCRAANDPGAGAEVYRRLREASTGAPLRLDLAALPGLGGELARNRGFELVDGAVTADLSAQRPLSPRLPTAWDRCGTVRLAAAVRHAESGVLRRLAETYEVKLTLTSSPRPFDLATFAVLDATELLDAGALDRDANKTIAQALGRDARLRAVAADLEKNYGALQQKLAGASAFAQSAPLVGAALQVVEAFRAAMPKPLVLVPALEGNGPNEVHFFPNRPLALLCTAATVDLAAFDLPAKVGRGVAGAQRAEPRFEAANTALEECLDDLKALPAAASSKPRAQQLLGQLEGLTRAWCEAAREVMASWLEVVRQYKATQDAFIEVAGAAYQALLPYLQAIAPADYFARSSACLVEGDATGSRDPGSVDEKLARLLVRGEAWNGILFVNNPNEELTLDRTFEGAVVVVATGNMTVRRAEVAAPERDRLTLVCFGRLTLAGPVRGSVVAGRSLVIEPQVRVTGNLVVRALTLSPGAGERALAGTVLRDPAVVAGPATVDGTAATVEKSRQMVTLGPYAVTTQLERR